MLSGFHSSNASPSHLASLDHSNPQVEEQNPENVAIPPADLKTLSLSNILYLRPCHCSLPKHNGSCIQRFYI
ncbi:hypothetical protein J6590_016893 [Homalodisca vitripennis]|nr:hypothetical protein J6590_016893 [Homalodisca vitripennis]